MTVNVIARIGFRIAECLRLSQGFGKRDAAIFNLAKNVVARTVQDSVDLRQSVSRESFLKTRDYGNASGNRRSKRNVTLLAMRQCDQFWSEIGDQLLVSRPHRFARCQCAPNPVSGRLQPANQFDYDVGVGG